MQEKLTGSSLTETKQDALVQAIQHAVLTLSTLWLFFEILSHIQQNLARIIRLNMMYLNIFVLGYSLALFFIFSIFFSLLSILKSKSDTAEKISSQKIATAFSYLIFSLLLLIFIQLGVNFAIVTGKLWVETVFSKKSCALIYKLHHWCLPFVCHFAQDRLQSSSCLNTKSLPYQRAPISNIKENHNKCWAQRFITQDVGVAFVLYAWKISSPVL